MFALILTILSAVTGLVWLLDKCWLGPRRRAALPADAPDQPSIVVEFCVSFFPVIFAVFMLRSFVVEPFRIPSGSMKPTLHIGDFILVNKFTYGLRCPVGSCKLLAIGEPKRGDVVVFKYPAQSKDDPNDGNDFIKRVIGLPGDHIHYEDKRLTVNDQPVDLEEDGTYEDEEGNRLRKHETLSGVHHDIIVSRDSFEGTRYGWVLPSDRFDYVVPEHFYFMMGDNRDGSFDSRGWGPAPEENLKGRAMIIWFNMIWLHWPDWSRIGTIIH
jgi:signal peptidase I